jgi:hypothetical protein
MDEAHGVVCRYLQEVREAEQLVGILTNQVDQDGEPSQVKRALRKVKLI